MPGLLKYWFDQSVRIQMIAADSETVGEAARQDVLRRSRDTCPHDGDDSPLRQAWLAGWDKVKKGAQQAQTCRVPSVVAIGPSRWGTAI